MILKIVVMARTIAIWIFGLLASAIIGGFAGIFAGHFSEMSPYAGTELWGALAGMFAFACLRLWLTAPSKTSSKGPTPPTPGR